MYFRLRDLLLLSALTSLPPCVNSIAPNNIVSRVPAPATIPGDKDSKGIPYIKSIEEFIKATVPAEKLNVIFYTNAKAHDIGLEFLHAKSPGLDGKGILYYDALTDEVVKGVNVDAKKDKDAWWVWVYRASTGEFSLCTLDPKINHDLGCAKLTTIRMLALGRTTDSEDVYIALDPSDCRSIFSPVQTYKSDGRIDTVGERSSL